MRCIFCKINSIDTISIEHVIPESLGNKEHVLPKGAVCDKCNNYFATKIEKELLDFPYFKSLRHRNRIPSKKNRIPIEKAFILHQKGDWVDLIVDKEGISISIDNPIVIDLIKSKKVNQMIVPIIPEPEKRNLILSRFLAKTALEYLTLRLCECEGWNEEIVDKTELDPIRNFARFGIGSYWEYHQRRIYNEDARFIDSTSKHSEPYEILHEMDLLYTDNNILYFIVAIMGIEYAINLGESEVSSYINWLTENNNKSPLYIVSENQIKKDEGKSE